LTPETRPLRVLFPFSGKTVGGSHISAIGLVQTLDQLGHEPVVAVHEIGRLTELLDQLHIDWIPLPVIETVNQGTIFRQLHQSLRAATPLAGLLRQHRIDIVHTNDDVMHQTWMAAARRCGTKHLWHLRTAGMSRRRVLFAGLFRAHFCTISTYCLESYPLYIRKRCAVVLNPVICNEPIERKSSNREWLVKHLNLPTDHPIIGFVGNQTEQKRPIQFLEIAKALKSHNPMSFVLVGERREPMASRVDQYIRTHELEDLVHQVGLQLPADRWISGFDVLVTTARAEGSGRNGFIHTGHCIRSWGTPGDRH